MLSQPQDGDLIHTVVTRWQVGHKVGDEIVVRKTVTRWWVGKKALKLNDSGSHSSHQVDGQAILSHNSWSSESVIYFIM